MAVVGLLIGAQQAAGQSKGLHLPGEQAADKAFEQFCDSEIGKKRAKTGAALADTGASFSEIHGLMANGCPLPRNPSRGERFLDRKNQDGMRHPYLLLIPADYDPSKRYPVRFYLHGGISRPPFKPGETWWRRPELNIGDWITVYPASWQSSMWWHPSQVENLAGILDQLKRLYNVDENRVYLIGISDGGSGVYYQAMRDSTPWAAFLPFIGSAGVISNPRHRDGDFHLANLSNRPFFIVNGEEDHLYPARIIEPFIDLLEASGTEVVYRPLPGIGHELRWWRDEKERIENFIEGHVRDPLPDQLEWETEWVDRYSRLHWLVITGLGSVEGESRFDNPGEGFFPRTGPYGRIAAHRSDNTVEVRTQGVRRFKILVSPDQFDLDRPVRVLVNGLERINQRVTPKVDTLVEWAARDLDRTMLFAGEIDIDLDHR